MPEHEEFVVFDRPHWRTQATKNTQTWGLQEPLPLVLAIVEEVGELATEMARMTIPAEDRAEVELEGWNCLMNAADVGRRTRQHLEATSEDPDGNPLPPEERPSYAARYTDPGETQKELQDLGALCYQLAASLDHQEGGGR